MSSATLQGNTSVESFFNVVETETFALFEHLSFEFLLEFDVFAPRKQERTRDSAVVLLIFSSGKLVITGTTDPTPAATVLTTLTDLGLREG